MSGSFVVRVHGVSFENEDGSSRQELVAQCRSGDPLTLRAEPDNPHDRHAVAVLNAKGEQLGYLPSDARDASAILRGEPIAARVLKVVGGRRWWHRVFGIERSWGLLVRLTKGEPDWNAFNKHREKAESVDSKVDAAMAAEKAGRIDEAVRLYGEALQSIAGLNKLDPIAAAHRYRAAPINRFSLLLYKQKRYKDAVAAIETWQSLVDPIGLGKADTEAVTKRLNKLRHLIA
jgi:HIRAN domain-containing protein